MDAFNSWNDVLLNLRTIRSALIEMELTKINTEANHVNPKIKNFSTEIDKLFNLLANYDTTNKKYEQFILINDNYLKNFDEELKNKYLFESNHVKREMIRVMGKLCIEISANVPVDGTHLAAFADKLNADGDNDPKSLVRGVLQKLITRDVLERKINTYFTSYCRYITSFSLAKKSMMKLSSLSDSFSKDFATKISLSELSEIKNTSKSTNGIISGLDNFDLPDFTDLEKVFDDLIDTSNDSSDNTLKNDNILSKISSDEVSFCNETIKDIEDISSNRARMNGISIEEDSTLLLDENISDQKFTKGAQEVLEFFKQKEITLQETLIYKTPIAPLDESIVSAHRIIDKTEKKDLKESQKNKKVVFIASCSLGFLSAAFLLYFFNLDN